MLWNDLEGGTPTIHMLGLGAPKRLWISTAFNWEHVKEVSDSITACPDRPLVYTLAKFRERFIRG